MGRRSIKSTKSGKFMNPTDQARKEARKKELKKNKKQRLLVRTNVLKNKDPGIIIQELDKLDEMEYNVNEPPQLAEKVLRDKRRKLKETLDRVMKLYQKEEPVYWNELKQIENDYERRRFHRIQYYEAVKQAEAVSNVEDIPLPPTMDIDFTLPPPPIIDEPARLHGILKSSMLATIQAPPTQFLGPGGKEPPGVPCGICPELSSSESDDSDSEGDAGDTKAISSDLPTPPANIEKESSITPVLPKKSVRFDTAEKEMDRFMKEVDEEFKAIKEDDLRPPGVDIDTSIPPPPVPKTPSPPPSGTTEKSVTPANGQTSSTITLPPPNIPPPPSGMPPPSFFAGNRPPYFPFPPPPLGIGIPPPPPPPRLRFSNRFRQPPRTPQTQAQSGKSNPDSKIVSEAMIQAKPQIRSLSSDVTRFVPVAVKTRKEDPEKEWKSASITPAGSMMMMMPPPPPSLRPSSGQKSKTTKDEAYEDFMKELKGLL